MATTAELSILITAKDTASKEIAGLGKSLGGLGGVGKVATAALAGVATVGIGLAAGIGKSINAAMNFESAMSGVGAVSGASAAELAALSAKALQLGQDTTLAGIGATDAAGAMQALAAGGVSTQDILEGAAQGALLLASAGGIDVPRAAEIAANALNNFGLSGQNAGHVADLLSAAANASSADVGDLGESLKYVGPVANAMGLSIEDVVATLAEFGSQGIKGSQAGTALRSIISSLAKPSDQASAAMKNLGLSFFDSSGHMKDMEGISGELQGKLSGLTDEQRANTLVTLFGNEALSAATILYGQGADGIAKYLGQVNVAGSAAETGAKRNDNLKGSIEQLKSSLETASITLGTAFLPAVRGIVDAVTGAVNAAIPFVQQYGPVLVAALQRGMAAVLGFGQAVAGGIGAVVGALQQLATGQITLAQFIGGMEIFVTTIRDKLAGLAVAAAPYIAAFFQAIGTAIATYAPQIGAQFLLWAASFVDWIQTVAIPFLAPRLAAFGQAILDWITGTGVPAITAAAQGLAAALANWITATAIPSLQTNLPLWLAALGTWLTGTALPAVTAFLAPLALAFGDWVTTTAVPWMLTTLPQWYIAIMTWIGGTAIPGIMGAMVAVGQAFGNWIATTAVPFLQANLPLWFVALGDYILGTVVPALVPLMEQVGHALADWVTNSAVPFLIQELPAWELAIVGWIVGTAIPAVVGALVSLGLAFGAWIATTAIPAALDQLGAWGAAVVGWLAGTALPAIRDQVRDIGAAMADALRTKLDEAKTAVTDAWDGIKTAIGTALDAVKTAVVDAWDGIKTAIATALDGIKTAVVDAWDGIKNSVTQALDAVKTAIGDGLTSAKDTAQTALDAMATAASTAMDNLKTAITNGIAGAGEAIRTGVAGFADIVLGVGDALYSAGAAIIGRLAAGIDSAIGTAVQKVKDGLSQIAGLLPHSEPKDPSSPLHGLTESGRAIFALIAEGIGQGSPAAIKAAADAASAVAKAITDTLGALTALGKLQMGKLPTGLQVAGFIGALTNFMERFSTAVSSFEDDVLKQASSFADAAGKVVGLVKNGVDGLMALSKFTPPLDRAVSAFIASLADFMEKFSTAAGGFEQDVLDDAVAFADAAGKVGAAVGNALKGLQDLASADWAKSSPTGGAMSWFTHLTASLVQNFATAAKLFADDALAEASAFADAAGKVGGAVKNALDGLAGLANADWAKTSPTGSAMGWFTHLTASLVQNFADASKLFADGALKAASDFADAAGKVMGTIGPAVQALGALNTLVTPPQQAVDNLLNAIRYIVGRFGEMATTLSTEGIKKLGDFSAAAAAALGAAKTGVDLFKDFDKLVVPSKLAIDNLVIAVHYVVDRFGEMADNLNTEGIARLQAFATAAGTALATAKTGTDLFKDMEKLVPPSKEAIDNLLAGIVYVVVQMGAIADQIGIDGMVKAQNFATGAKNVFDTVKAALDTVNALKNYKDLPADALRAIKLGLENAIDEMRGRIGQAHALEQDADTFLGSMREAARKVAEGMALMGAATPPSGGGGGGGQEPPLTIDLPAPPIILGAGGIVRKPLLAMIGERGPEAVVPLGRRGGLGGGTVVNINYPVLLGQSAETARQLAAIITPAQNRQIGYTVG